MPPASSDPGTPPPPSRWTHAFRAACLLGACAGFAAVWVILCAANERQNSWMALLGALDVIWIMRLVGWPAGPGRHWVAVAATAVIVVVANWWIVAVQLGYAMGFSPLDSALRLGPHHAWTLVQLANGPWDALLIGASLVLAAIASR
ncbi:hypothetical protein [Agrilutibacter solisilvae]|uniref:Transmembrane protein n=1 Tax=Agrilutibacter solisilvae TaxID=2763317 RepID=A0A975AT95_9GAMM|nr:hypothetical protein [Lysobacter solisilvae]QSX79804.1 hypothetical protein I8J32_008225 [Lysobacter solisilvae]